MIITTLKTRSTKVIEPNIVVIDQPSIHANKKKIKRGRNPKKNQVPAILPEVHCEGEGSATKHTNA